MLKLEDVHKGYMKKDHSWNYVLRGVSFELKPDMNLGILGRNGAGKSTLLRLIAGQDLPDKGLLNTKGSKLSWPLGGGGGVHAALTGKENIKFIATIYDRDYEEVLDYVEDFAELGDYLNMPLRSYSAGMKGRLAFGISMAMDFDTYLVDEGFSAGDARFRERSAEIFTAKREHSNIVVVSHNPGSIKKFCNCAGVLREGRLKIYQDMDEAIQIYQEL